MAREYSITIQPPTARPTSGPWVDFEGNPLKFQDGVRVKVSRSPEHPGRIDGWVRGYELFREGGGGPGEAAYEVFFTGDPSQMIREGALERQPDHMQRDHAHYSATCGICGLGM